MKDTPSVIEFITDPQLLDLSLSPAQETLLRVIDGLPLNSEQKEIFRLCTGRKVYRERPCHEACVLCGARGGKTGRIATPHAAHKAAFGTHVKYLARGERATIPIVAQDFRAGRIAFSYLESFFTRSPLLSSLIDDVLAYEIRLTTRTDMVVFPCTKAATRGYSIPEAIEEEVAFWRLEGSANADVEIQQSIRRGMIQFPDAQIIKITTPFLKDGVAYSDFRDYWGHDDAPVLVWKASSVFMNPSLGGQQLEAQRRLDPVRFNREFEAEFLDPLEAFLRSGWVETAIATGCHERAPVAGFSYVGAIDQSERQRDSFTLAIVHAEDDRIIRDVMRAWGPRGDMADLHGTVREIAAICDRYGVREILGDQQAKGWLEETCRQADMGFSLSEPNTSECYLECEPLFAQGRIQILDHPELVRELRMLERKPRPGGKFSVDHPRAGHDDHAAALCRAAVNASPTTAFELFSSGRRTFSRDGDIYSSGAGSFIDDRDFEGSPIDEAYPPAPLGKVRI